MISYINFYITYNDNSIVYIFNKTPKQNVDKILFNNNNNPIKNKIEKLKLAIFPVDQK